jgi:parvulin-like peptidyl-prolyl isomerase
MSRKQPEKPQKQLTRKQLSRREHEARTRKLLIIGTAVVVGLVVLILGWGLYQQYVLRPRQPVATVYGVPLTLGEYQKLVQFRRWDWGNRLDRLESQKQQLGTSSEDQSYLIQYIDQQIQQIQSQQTNVATAVLDAMIDDQLVRHEAAQRGISVSAEEVQTELEKQFGYDRNPPTPTPTSTAAPITSTEPITITPAPTMTPAPTEAPMTEEQFTEQSTAWFSSMAEGSGFREHDLRRLIESSLYYNQVTEAIKAEAPTTAEQVHAQHILLKTKEEAEAALARLRNGEDFAALAAELSQDTSNKDNGGDLGWFSRGQMVAEFEEAAFALQPGQISEVVQSSFGFHIIRVQERDANRTLEGSALIDAQDRAVSDWFAAQRTVPEVVRSWDSTMVPAEREQPPKRR